MEQKTYREKNASPLRKRMHGAIAMLIMAALVLAQSSYAWLTLANAPEAADIQTVVGANGSLEIALATAQHLSELHRNDMFETEIYNKLATGDLLVDNTLWGNVLDLSNSAYGLRSLIMKPAALNVKNGTIQSNPILVADYGTDGRISRLNGGTAMGIYDPTTRVFRLNEEYGVRAAGQLADTRLLELTQSMSNDLSGDVSLLLQVAGPMLAALYAEQADSDASYTLGTLRQMAAAMDLIRDKAAELTEKLNTGYAKMFGDGEDSPVVQANRLWERMDELVGAATNAMVELEDDKAVPVNNAAPPETEMTAEELRTVLDPIVGMVTFLKWVEAQGETEAHWEPVDAYDSAEMDRVTLSLGEDGALGIAALLGGGFEQSYEAAPKSYRFAPPAAAETASISAQVLAGSMKCAFLNSKAQLELDWAQIPTHRWSSYQLLSEEYDNLRLLFLRHALNEAPVEGYSFQTWIQNGFLQRLLALQSEADFFHSYLRNAILCYTASGALSPEIFVAVSAQYYAEADALELLETAGLTDPKLQNAAEAWKSLNSRIQSALNTVEVLRGQLTTPAAEEGGDPVFRDEITFEELSGMLSNWSSFDAMAVGGYDIDSFAEHREEVLATTLSSLTAPASQGVDSVYSSLTSLVSSPAYTKTESITLSPLVGAQADSDAPALQYYVGKTITARSASSMCYDEERVSGNNQYYVSWFGLNAVAHQIETNFPNFDWSANAHRAAFQTLNTEYQSGLINSLLSNSFAELLAQLSFYSDEYLYAADYRSALLTAADRAEVKIRQADELLLHLIMMYAAGKDTSTYDHLCLVLNGIVDSDSGLALLEVLCDDTEESALLTELSKLSLFDKVVSAVQTAKSKLSQTNTLLQALPENTALSWEQLLPVAAAFIGTYQFGYSDVLVSVPSELFLAAYSLSCDLVNTEATENGPQVLSRTLENDNVISSDWSRYSYIHNYTVYHEGFVSDYFGTSIPSSLMNVGAHSFGRIRYYVSFGRTPKNMLYPYYLLTYGAELPEVTDRQYVYNAVRPFIQEYARQAEEAYQAYSGGSSMAEMVAALYAPNGAVFDAQQLLNDTKSLAASMRAYKNYIENALLLIAADSSQPQETYEAVLAAPDIDGMLAALGDAGDPWASAWQFAKPALNAAAQAEQLLSEAFAEKGSGFLTLEELAPIAQLLADPSTLVEDGTFLSVRNGATVDAAALYDVYHWLGSSGIYSISADALNTADTVAMRNGIDAVRKPTDGNASRLLDAGFLLSDTYCFAVDLLLKTNAGSARLLLQTEGIGRINGAANLEEEDPGLLGAGSFIRIPNQGMQNAICVVFADTLTGEIYATARADEFGYLRLEDGDTEITQLERNRVLALTAWVYLDGNRIVNADPASSVLTELQVNLQFATDVTLYPMGSTE